MGENLAAEGRMAVRTPMQWTSGRNGGFSRATAGQAARPGDRRRVRARARQRRRPAPRPRLAAQLRPAADPPLPREPRARLGVARPRSSTQPHAVGPRAPQHLGRRLDDLPAQPRRRGRSSCRCGSPTATTPSGSSTSCRTARARSTPAAAPTWSSSGVRLPLAAGGPRGRPPPALTRSDRPRAAQRAPRQARVPFRVRRRPGRDLDTTETLRATTDHRPPRPRRRRARPGPRPHRSPPAPATRRTTRARRPRRRASATSAANAADEAAVASDHGRRATPAPSRPSRSRRTPFTVTTRRRQGRRARHRRDHRGRAAALRSGRSSSPAPTARVARPRRTPTRPDSVIAQLGPRRRCTTRSSASRSASGSS